MKRWGHETWRLGAVALVTAIAMSWGLRGDNHFMGASQPVMHRSLTRWHKGLLGERERIIYQTIGHQRLTFYIFRPTASTARSRPVVIYFHGGALQYGSALITRRNTPHNQLLVAVERGVIRRGDDFVSVNYRLAPRYPWPHSLQDVKHAVRYIATHARGLHINRSDVTLMGDSAGGQLATFVGLTWPSPAPQSAVIRGVVDMFGPTDRRLYALRWRERYGLKPNPVFGTYTPESIKRDSAVSYVHSGAPPFLIIQGTEDRIVPASQSQLLMNRLRAANVPAREIVVHHAGHEFVAVGGPIDPSLSQLSEEILDFLQDEMSLDSSR